MAQRQFRSDDTDKWKEGFGDGSDGALSISADTTEAPIDSTCSGTATQNSLTATNASFANGQLILIHQSTGTGVAAWELNKIYSYSAGTITTSYALINTYTNSGYSKAQVRVLKEYTDVTINSTKTYKSKVWDGSVGGIMAFFASGTVTITGTLSALGNNGTLGSVNTNTYYAGGTMGYGGGQGHNNNGQPSAQGYQGNSYSAAGGGATGANAGAGGGGYATTASNRYNAGGGGGGHATGGQAGGTQNGSTGGAAGGTYGTASLTSIYFGSGGGGGANTAGGATTTGGGAGGGIVFICGKTISVGGAITVKGGNQGGSPNAPGGGGSGGSVLLKCQTATLGTTLITAAGGTGGNTAGSSYGGDAGVGRIHLDYKTSYTGTTTPTIDATQDITLDYPASANFFMFFN